MFLVRIAIRWIVWGEGIGDIDEWFHTNVGLVFYWISRVEKGDAVGWTTLEFPAIIYVWYR